MYPLFFLSALLAEIIGTIAGFGSSTVFLPLALLFLDFKTALVLVAIFHIFGNISRVGFFKHGLDKRLIVKFGLPSVLLTLLGAMLVPYISQDLLKVFLGIFLVIYAFISLWKDNLQVKPTTANTIIGGSLSGFLAGLIGTGGALRGAFLTAYKLPKEKYIATAATIALAVDFIRLPVYIFQGFLNKEFYWYIPILLTLAVMGSYIGKQIVSIIPQHNFRKLVLVALILIGVKFIFDFVS
ncbi:sulfonate transporter [candidate division WWE3 bacterium RIFCSPHIGHO2_12_FULL_38_15]|uniref:Probable membrane transporter protein n=1 Tax=candidate division WWE3 bacterium RIFCSPHIGHO2_02_FULL_38_14 TaxID=1802620 RepID=A0A1F4V7P9_UNCKA|nr:MAG: sulfonate transporter [candidate division WWE3 bacterium RIFCSPHIGHO2_01_FULL_38_45]OGC48959.1 MAG: sulfonate transporter [candidate division WWE3 bacterium RIFCSPHIGHO2_12_FULL_38_15]OGC53265.1 MAG: sulfonate transporter [candidate division WWE3 bacterium RIFCSPHIGHO2_02_FULL_38_14]OGC53716.1 MAG: sulfonate transporter [candidate division WWE3 bacterium RIFCSPLOWO2_01_FULL_37_24]